MLQLSKGADWVGEQLLQESPEQAEVQRGIAKDPGPVLIFIPQKQRQHREGEPH